MVILSLLLSIGILISFNLYQTFPAKWEVELENQAVLVLDSLIDSNQIKEVSFYSNGYQVVYSVNNFEDFENVKQATIIVTDTLGNTETKRRIFTLSNEE